MTQQTQNESNGADGAGGQAAPSVVVYSAGSRNIRQVCRSVASLRRAGVTEDIVVLTLGTDRPVSDPYLVSECKAIIPVDGILREFGFSSGGWNRRRPYSELACLAMPLVPQLSAYGRALTVSSTVLALRPEFKTWFSCSMRGFEAVGAACSGRSAELSSEYTGETFKCFQGRAAEDMRSHVWRSSSPACRTYSNPGVYMWDLTSLRSGLSRYCERLRLFWAAETKGNATRLADTFVSVFLDSAAGVSTALNVTQDDQAWLTGAAAFNYERKEGDGVAGVGFNKASATKGLDDDITAAMARVSATRVMGKCSAGKLAVVHITDGNPDDCQRMVWSMRSLARYSNLEFDSIVLTPPKVTLPDIASAAPQLLQHGAVKQVSDIADTLGALSITDAGWNRAWPFVVLYRLGIPLHEVFAEYDRVLYLDTDVLVLSEQVDRFLSADLTGYELGGVIDTVQEEHARIRRVVDNDLRPDFSVKISAMYGDTLRLKPYVNAGVLLWNMPEIRKGIPWYKERLRMFWEAECRGMFGFLDQDFINSMMTVNTNFSMLYNWFTKSGVEADDGECVIRHYCAHNYEKMEQRAEAIGLLTKEEVLKYYGKQ